MTRKEAKPYQIAEICYNAEWPDKPWYVVRTGNVHEQGGLSFNTEHVSFETLKDALNYLEETILADLDEYKERIKNK